MEKLNEDTKIGDINISADCSVNLVYGLVRVSAPMINERVGELRIGMLPEPYRTQLLMMPEVCDYLEMMSRHPYDDNRAAELLSKLKGEMSAKCKCGHDKEWHLPRSGVTCSGPCEHKDYEPCGGYASWCSCKKYRPALPKRRRKP